MGAARAGSRGMKQPPARLADPPHMHKKRVDVPSRPLRSVGQPSLSMVRGGNLDGYADEVIYEAIEKAPRDACTGQASGKRVHVIL